MVDLGLNLYDIYQTQFDSVILEPRIGIILIIRALFNSAEDSSNKNGIDVIHSQLVLSWTIVFRQYVCGGHAHWNLLESRHATNQSTRASATRWKNVLKRPYINACVRACGSQPIITSSPHPSWPIRSRQPTSEVSQLRCTLALSTPVSRLTRWFCVSPISL